MSFIPKPQEIYKHFKGNLYQITAIAEHTETGEQMVIYQAMYGDFKIYARPLSMFISPVDKEKYPDVTQEFRFELQGPDAGRQKAESAPLQKAESPVVPEKKAAPEPEVGSEGGESELDPMLVEFLDATSYEERLNILKGMHHRITDHMISTMAIVCDVEVGDGSVEERYEQLLVCLQTMQKYEGKRLR